MHPLGCSQASGECNDGVVHIWVNVDRPENIPDLSSFTEISIDDEQGRRSHALRLSQALRSGALRPYDHGSLRS